MPVVYSPRGTHTVLSYSRQAGVVGIGRHGALKMRCPKGRTGSSPVTGTGGDTTESVGRGG